MDNNAMADQFSLLAKLMDIHGDNSFKAKSYANAAYTIEKLPQPLADLPKEKIAAIKGIGESVAGKIMEILTTGELSLLQEYLQKTPEGVLELMKVKGLGPKKVHQLWKKLQIENLDQLRDACKNNMLAAQKGFGEKTQQNILQSIEFREQNAGKYLYAQIEAFAELFTAKISEAFPDHTTKITGQYVRQLEIIDQLEWVTTIPKENVKQYLVDQALEIVTENEDEIIGRSTIVLDLHFYCTSPEKLYSKLFVTGSSPDFLEAWESSGYTIAGHYQDEASPFETNGLAYLPPYLRETPGILQQAKRKNIPGVIQMNQVKGIIHSHSNWSDGAYTVEEMAREAMRLGYEYLVVSDHSKAAFYANGLSEQRIKEQHKYIDSLNEKLAPFKLFKSIECDILNDGSMDYSNKVLSTFDIVIASVHSNLDMPLEKAMTRLMGAITNPYVTILGHMTGRILLKRKGFPVDHTAIIDACAANSVVIEINASPYRLDMDWRWIPYALEKGVKLSINPDAHSFDDMQVIKYGVLAAQKGGLTAGDNISSLSLPEFEQFIAARKNTKGLM